MREATSIKLFNELLQGNDISDPISTDTLCYINMLCNMVMIIQKFSICVKFLFKKTMIEHKAYYYKVPTADQKQAGTGHLKYK